jgi:hypothetical protein
MHFKYQLYFKDEYNYCFEIVTNNKFTFTKYLELLVNIFDNLDRNCRQNKIIKIDNIKDYTSKNVK